MDYIKGATDYLGLTNTEAQTAPLTTAAPTSSGAVAANDLLKKKELNDEILDNDLSLNRTKPDISLKKDINEEIRQHDHNLNSTKPDLSSKQDLNREIRNLDKSEVLHSGSRLPDTSAKQELNRELLHADKDNLLQHNSGQYDSELRRAGEQPLSLNTLPGQQGINLDSPSIGLRPEFQNTPFLPREEHITKAPGSILPPQMLSEQQISFNSPQVSNFSSTQGINSGISSGISAGGVRAPVVMETIQKDVVVREHIHPVQKEEIQPIIYREREQLDVKQVTQMMHETQIQPTIIQQRELPAERREAIIERSAPIPSNYVAPSVEIDATRTTQVIHAPIVQEVIKKTIVEEVQPVLERDVFVPTVVQNTVPIYEKIIEAPQVTREIVDMRGGNSSSIYVDNSLSQGSYNSQDSYLSQNSQPGLAARRLSVGAVDNYGTHGSSMTTSSAQYNNLPTGQVLPQVQSSRPAWAHLPQNYQQNRPDFIGTSSQYVLAQNGAALGQNDLSKGLYNPYAQGQTQMNHPITPQAYQRQ